MPDATYKAP